MQSSKELQQLRNQAGRINASEYSRLTKTPISTQQLEKARRNAKRINVAEYGRITAKRQKRKAGTRKRTVAK